MTLQIGRALGVGSPKGARAALRGAERLTAVSATLFGLLLLAGSRPLSTVLAPSSQAVQSQIQTQLPLGAVVHVDDSFYHIAAGVLTGLGLRAVGSRANLLGYYGLGVPCGLRLGFFAASWGAVGLWAGLGLSNALGLGLVLRAWHESETWEAVANRVKLAMAGRFLLTLPELSAPGVLAQYRRRVVRWARTAATSHVRKALIGIRAIAAPSGPVRSMVCAAPAAVVCVLGYNELAPMILAS